MSDSTSVLKKASALDISPEFDTYSRVILHVGKDNAGNEIVYTAGDESGRTIEVSNPWGTQQMANNLLASLQSRRFQYQPYDAVDAQVDPSAELGDGLSISDVYSGLYVQNTTFSSLMTSDIAAPTDEEIDHEFPYETETERTFSRESAYTRSQIKITNDSITAEVARASNAEGSLSSRITQTAESITAEVTRATAAEGNLGTRITQTANSVTAEITNRTNADTALSNRISATASDLTVEIQNRTNADTSLSSRITANATAISARVTQTGGNRSSFGWELLATGFKLSSGGTDVFVVNSSGATVKGTITATSGYIGNGSSGFTIGSRAIYNGVTSLSDTTHSGIYLGTDGINLGQGKFKVTSAGALTATNATISGKVTATSGAIGGFTIGSASIYNGMTSYSDTAHNGVYVGTNGIALGGGKFKVDSSGNVTASSITINGGSVYASSIKTDYVNGFGGSFNGGGISSRSIGRSSIKKNTISKEELESAIGVDIDKGIDAYNWVTTVWHGNREISAERVYTSILQFNNKNCSWTTLNYSKGATGHRSHVDIPGYGTVYYVATVTNDYGSLRVMTGN